MKILLCGDYSSVHTELAKALRLNGHSVTVLSDGDGYKNIQADIKISASPPQNYFGKLWNLFFDFLGLFGLRKYLSFRKKYDLGRYDVIQMINPVVIPAFGAIGNLMFIKHLEKHTDAFYLCALGDDKTWVSSCLRGSFKYSPLNRLTFKNFYRYYYSLKYVVSPAYAYLDRYAVKKAKAIIAGLDDYFLAYKDLPNVRLIRLPISRDHFVQPKYKDLEKEPLVIFHAWQKGKELKKGNDILHEAALSAVRKYGEKKIKYVIASGLPYEEYLKAYNDCDIYLDQVYSYDGGVTAALGMAAGKVVFSGYELFAEYSGKAPNSIKNVGVNASSNLAQLEESLFYIIENTHVLDDLKHKAYFYALNNYESIMIAEKYIDVWTEGEK